MAYDSSLIDKRVVERNIAKGLVDPEALKKVIEALPDRESNCVRVSLDGEALPEGSVADEGVDEGADESDDEEDDSED